MTRPMDPWGMRIGGVTIEGVGAIGALPMKGSAATTWSRPSGPATTSGNPGDLSVADAAELCIDVEVTAASGTLPTLVLTWERKGGDGVYYPIWTSPTLMSASKTSVTIGPGAQVPQAVGATGRLAWALGGVTPSFTFSASVVRD